MISSVQQEEELQPRQPQRAQERNRFLQWALEKQSLPVRPKKGRTDEMESQSVSHDVDMYAFFNLILYMCIRSPTGGGE